MAVPSVWEVNLIVDCVMAVDWELSALIIDEVSGCGVNVL